MATKFLNSFLGGRHIATFVLSSSKKHTQIDTILTTVIEHDN